jgi:hypothetical protein
MKLAVTLAKEHPDFPEVEIAKSFLFVAVGMFLPRLGDGGTADFLHQLAARIERGEGVETLQ